MINSMTAFAQELVQGPWGTLRWELKSVNHRFAEFYFKLPEELKSLESSLRELSRKTISRGKLESHLRFEINSEDCHNREIHINKELAKKVISACQEISQYMGSSSQFSPLEVLSWPDVVQSRANFDLNILKEAVHAGFQTVLKKLTKARGVEGGELVNIILLKIEKVEENISKIQQQYPEVLASQKQKLLAGLQDIQAEVNQSRLEQEMLYLTQKSDIAEEFERLIVHVKEAKRILNQGGVVGRRLDFLLQEMNREANTLASKSVDSLISLAAVELKVLIEQMREQVQNLE